MGSHLTDILLSGMMNFRMRNHLAITGILKKVEQAGEITNCSTTVPVGFMLPPGRRLLRSAMAH